MPIWVRFSLSLLTALLFSLGASPASPASLEAQVKTLRAEIRKEAGLRPPPVPIPANNPQTQAKVRLGEALFFDPNLSGCGNVKSVACATCHLPEKGFSDGLVVSRGCKGARGRRNTQTVYQTAYLSHLFWDGRVQSLEQQALDPVVDPAEMANTWDHVLAYLKTGTHPETGKTFPEAQQFYAQYFAKVFDGEISSTTVAKAIAAYERTVNSWNAPFDRWLRGNDAALSPAQKKGLVVFFGRGKCAGCHNPPHFTDSDFHNLGVPNAGYEKPEQFPSNAAICTGITPNVDPGRAEVPALQASCEDVATFKTPTLRNVALTAPYMHNGAFATLEAVMAHFEALAQGTIAPLAGELDTDVRKGAFLFGAGGGEADDAANMVAFMQALTGSQVVGPQGGVAPPKLP